MPEPIEPIKEPTQLEKAHAEVLVKRKQDKERIVALEAQVAASEASVHELTINGPLRTMSESLSVAPEMLHADFQAQFKFEIRDGKLTILTLEGKPITHNGSIVPFERDAILKMLLDTKDEAKLKLYRATLIASKASGGSSHHSKASIKPASTHSFGLR